MTQPKTVMVGAIRASAASVPLIVQAAVRFLTRPEQNGPHPCSLVELFGRCRIACKRRRSGRDRGLPAHGQADSTSRGAIAANESVVARPPAAGVTIPSEKPKRLMRSFADAASGIAVVLVEHDMKLS